jgi:Domain of unknown function (DUF4276)
MGTANKFANGLPPCLKTGASPPLRYRSGEREAFSSPEHINDDPLTAPSKRILKCCDGYEKPLHGSLIAIDIGLEAIRQQCQHFNQWLLRLENLI